MVARGPGDVGCAHCTQLGATTPCRVCALLVCDACARDWTTCSEPSGREIRLGTTARIRDVDPAGRLAFVARWRGPIRLFDLRQLRWVDGPLLPRRNWQLRRVVPRLTTAGLYYVPRWIWADNVASFAGLTLQSIYDRVQVFAEAPMPSHGSQVSSSGDVYWYVSDEQTVVVFLPTSPTTPLVLTPLPYKVVQAAHIDGERNLLASGTWGEVALHQLDGDKLTVLGRVKTTGYLYWIGVAGPYVVAVIGHDEHNDLVVWRLTQARAIGELAYTLERIGGFDVAAISRDGRHFAYGSGTRLVVYDLDARTNVTLEGHTDRISYVRFAADHTLISADDDNRVILRPRTATGYAAPLIAVDIPDERVPLPPRSA